VISTEVERAKSYWHSDLPGEMSIPVARPRLPTTDEIAPYLRRIDASRWYSNGGPLVQEFEERLAQHFSDGSASVATVANATIGLAVALLAHDLPHGSLCMVPAWTFAATGHAIQLAGLIPWMVDISLTSWALEPQTARKLLGRAPGKVSVVMPVSPFGAPIDYAGWESFSNETGIPVVIDAAAAFDSIRASSVPAVVSLHATKVLGIGEGGFIVSTDQSFIEETQKRANFGFWNSREAAVASLNAKMSEYSAAVGLAGLDDWPKTRSDFVRVAFAYRQQLASQNEISLQDGFGQTWVTSTTIIESRQKSADAIGVALATNRFGSRRWWGGGLHRHAAFATLPRVDTPRSERLAESVIGLPCWRDLPNDEIIRICDIILSKNR
jgi:dTDP-4-amino-4,6-dideoxygalactose transaminase